MVRNERDNTGVLAPAITVTNFTEDLTLDCDSMTNDELGDVLGTVIRALQQQGILNGTVSA